MINMINDIETDINKLISVLPLFLVCRVCTVFMSLIALPNNQLSDKIVLFKSLRHCQRSNKGNFTLI